MPAVEGTPFPIYHGAIIDSQIDKILVKELRTNKSVEAKIVGSGNLRIWYLYMGKYKGSKFDIKAFSKEGKEISDINDDVSPYSVDQKPMKQEIEVEFISKFKAFFK